ncbi:MAG: hypothetical protein P1U53_06705 [Sulfitobacter sp.]|nr:hypothetical protein [Sulfitobacter sp.]
MKALLTALALCAPLPALALSCLVPSVERSFQQYDAAREQYLVVHGRLTLDESALPQTLMTDQQPPQMTRLPAELSGKSLSQAGFQLPFDQAVTLEVACLGPWCGSAQDGTDVLAFVRKDAAGYAIEIDPCGGALFVAPKLRQLEAVEDCLKGEACEPKTR